VVAPGDVSENIEIWLSFDIGGTLGGPVFTGE